jgi:hypothetical protein
VRDERGCAAPRPVGRACRVSGRVWSTVLAVREQRAAPGAQALCAVAMSLRKIRVNVFPTALTYTPIHFICFSLENAMLFDRLSVELSRRFWSRLTDAKQSVRVTVLVVTHQKSLRSPSPDLHVNRLLQWPAAG